MIIKKIKPMFTAIVTTKDKWAADELPKTTLIDPKKMQGSLKEYQKVVAVGSAVRDIKVGDIVKINPSHYAEYGPYKPGDGMRAVINGQEKSLLGYSFPTIELSGIEHLFLQERDIEYIVEEWEDEKASDIIQPDKSLIIP